MIKKIKISTDEQTTKLLDRISAKIEDAIDAGLSNYDIEEVKSVLKSSNDSLDSILGKIDTLLAKDTTKKIKSISDYLHKNMQPKLLKVSRELKTITEKQTDDMDSIETYHEKYSTDIEGVQRAIIEISDNLGKNKNDLDSLSNSISLLRPEMQNILENITQKIEDIEQTQMRMEIRVNAPWYKRLWRSRLKVREEN